MIRLKAYIDTSLLVKRYVPELGSDELDQFLCDSQPDMWVSELSRLELASTLARKRREGQFTQRQLDAIQIQADEDLLSGNIEVAALHASVVSRALGLMRSLKQPLATLDSIHLATALIQGIELFMTNDRQLARAAAETGLTVWPTPAALKT